MGFFNLIIFLTSFAWMLLLLLLEELLEVELLLLLLLDWVSGGSCCIAAQYRVRWRSFAEDLSLELFKLLLLLLLLALFGLLLVPLLLLLLLPLLLAAFVLVYQTWAFRMSIRQRLSSRLSIDMWLRCTTRFRSGIGPLCRLQMRSWSKMAVCRDWRVR